MRKLSIKNHANIVTAMLAIIAAVLIAAGVFCASIFGASVPLNSRATAYAAVASSGFASSAKSAYLMDTASGYVIFSKNENARLPIASMTKIMTALLTLEAIDSEKLSLDTEIVISDEAAHMGGSQVFLDAGSQHTVANLLKSVIVASANDSSVALAEHIGGSVGGFVGMMNDKAKSLGMENTHFVNCTGLPAPESFSSAKDVSAMFRELITHPKYFDYSTIWLEDYLHPSGRKTVMTNTNKLVRFYKGCDGGKTGFTSEAKFCLSATATRDGMRLVGVVVGESDSKVRFNDVSEMFNNAFNNYSNKTLISKGDAVANSVEVVGGKASTVKLTVERNLSAFMSKNDAAKFELKFELPQSVKAKIEVGEKIGRAYLTKDGVVVDEVNVIALEGIARASIFDAIKKIGDKW